VETFARIVAEELQFVPSVWLSDPAIYSQKVLLKVVPFVMFYQFLNMASCFLEHCDDTMG
jgi:hypothetical protein